MIPASDNQSGIGNFVREEFERLNHQFQPFVRSPLAKSQDSVRIASARKFRKFRSAGEDAVSTKMDVVPSVLIVENFSITRHEDRDRIRQQKHPGGDRPGHPI
jgi:hypothetical protein